MPLAEELTLVYARLSGLLLAEETVQTALGLVTSLAVDTVAGAAGAGVTLVDGSAELQSAAATSELVARADALQYELGEGPCLTAVFGQQVVHVDDLEQDHRWPRWREAALPLGLRSSVSAPLLARGQCQGAVKVYGQQAAAFSSGAVGLMGRFGEQAAILISNVSSLTDAAQLSDSLRAALRSRNTIALATGVLMERQGLTEEQAFLRMVDDARTEQRELATRAQAVVDSVHERE